MSTVCKHGGLARSCEICELTEERDEAVAALKEAMEYIKATVPKCQENMLWDVWQKIAEGKK